MLMVSNIYSHKKMECTFYITQGAEQINLKCFKCRTYKNLISFFHFSQAKYGKDQYSNKNV